MRLSRILRIVRDLLHERICLRVLALEPRHQHPAFAVGVEREGHGALGWDKREADVIQHIGGVEEDDAVEPRVARVRGKARGAFAVFGLLDLHAARSFSRQAGSSSRNRRTRSPTGGWVTKSAPRPASMNGLMV